MEHAFHAQQALCSLSVVATTSACAYHAGQEHSMNWLPSTSTHHVESVDTERTLHSWGPTALQTARHVPKERTLAHMEPST